MNDAPKKRGRPRKRPKPETTYDASPPLTPARQVMVNLDERTINRLDDLAAAARLSRSAMVRRLVAEA